MMYQSDHKSRDLCIISMNGEKSEMETQRSRTQDIDLPWDPSVPSGDPAS